MTAPKRKRGRPKGSRNKLSFDLKAVMSGRMTEKAMLHLEKVLEHPDTPENVRLKAIELILAYGHGKPQNNTLVGVEAGPNLKELMVRFMAPGETMKEVRQSNAKVIEHLDPDNTKRKAY